MDSGFRMLDHSEFKLKGNNNVSWNIVDGDTYKNVIKDVFNNVAQRIEFTMGPYGGDTVFEKAGRTAMTKDGWTVLQNITFNNPVYNSILTLLKNTCAPVVIKVGDGSSTAVCSANNIYNLLMSSKIMENIRPKDVVDRIETICEKICEEILNRSKKVESFDEIYKIALTSTNNNKEFAEIIRKIYEETENSTIDFVESKGSKTSYEIIKGFRGNGVYLDRIYQTTDDGRCVVKNPVVLCFDFKIDEEEYNHVIKPVIEKALVDNKRVVVYAPYYSDSLLEKLRFMANQEFKALGTTNVVYCRAPIAANDLIDNYRDFVLMLGGTMITQAVMNDLMPKYQFNPETKKNEKIEEARMFPVDCIGSCEVLSISDKHSTIEGITNLKSAEYDLVVKDINVQLNKANEDSENLNIVSNRSFSLKKRLARLKGKMAVITVGGRTSLEKGANMDAFDDAVKACESAYIYGYNIGGSLIIPIVCDYLKKKEPHDELTEQIYDIISEAMQKVYSGVLAKYFTKADDESKIKDIIEHCIEEKVAYNLITKSYSDDVINPCMTDIEVLKASTSMTSMLLSSNQYISLSPSEDIF